MQVVQPELEGHRGRFLAQSIRRFFLTLDDFLDARRVNAAVGDQALDRLLGDLAAVGIEAREDDGRRRIVPSDPRPWRARAPGCLRPSRPMMSPFSDRRSAESTDRHLVSIALFRRRSVIAR